MSLAAATARPRPGSLGTRAVGVCLASAFAGRRCAGGHPAAHLTHADAVRAAARDAAALAARDPALALRTKYFSAHHLADQPRKLYELFQVLSLHVNLLSTKGFIVVPVPVETWLWRIDVDRYGWSRKLFSTLITGKGPFAVDPWFHVLSPAPHPRYRPNAAGLTPVPAPWLNRTDVETLWGATDSNLPIIRADWFVHRTAIQAGRDGFGYYDFLGLKTRDDFDRLVGLDRKLAIKLFRERAVIVRESDIAASGSRQMVSLGCGTGRAWITKDVSSDSFGQARKNVLDQRLEDLDHDAEEGIAPLPNELPCAYLSDARGNLQKTAPDTIVKGDSTTVGPDRRVHVGLSCFSCHEKAGLKPFKDLERQLGRPAVVNQVKNAADEARKDRQDAAYKAEIQHLFDADVALFTRAMAEVTGLTKPADVSRAYRRAYDEYDAADVTAAVLARDVGLSEAELVARLKDKLLVKEGGEATVYPPTLNNILAARPEPVSRGKEEELVPYLMPILGYPGRVEE